MSEHHLIWRIARFVKADDLNERNVRISMVDIDSMFCLDLCETPGSGLVVGKS